MKHSKVWFVAGGPLSLLLAALLLSNGCISLEDTTTQTTLGGAGIGALAGGVIGHQRGRGAEGAAIGAVAGGALGYLVGTQIDQARPKVTPVLAGPNAPTVIVEAFENKSGAMYEVSEQGTVVQVGTRGQPIPMPVPAGRTVVSDVIGQGLGEEFRSALAATGVRIVAPRGIAAEQVQADFIIRGAVTSFMRGEFGVAGGMGRQLHGRPIRVGPRGDPVVRAGGVFSSIFADQAFGVGVDKAHMAMVVEVYRPAGPGTVELIGTVRAEGSPLDLQGALSGFFGGSLQDWGMQYQTPMGKAIRACMIRAANGTAVLISSAWGGAAPVQGS